MPADAEHKSFTTESGPSFFIDSHCHFDFSDFDVDRKKIWRDSNSRGVLAAVIPGIAVDEWRRAKKICQEFNALYFSVGVHPWWVEQLFGVGVKVKGAKRPENAKRVEDVIPALRQQHIDALKDKKCVAIGECGLDKMIAASVEHQYEVFDYQVKLAAEYHLPLIIHSRKAHGEVMHHLNKVSLSRGGVVHAFSGGETLAKQYVERGFYLGVGGSITYERAKKTRETIRKMPLSCIVLETDAPNMPIQGRQGQRNSPEYLPEIAQVVAEIKGVTVEEVAQKTTENSCRLFSLNPAAFAC